MEHNNEKYIAMFDEGYLSCNEIFCESIEAMNTGKPTVPVQINNSTSFSHQQQQAYTCKTLPKVLQVKAMVDKTLTSDLRVLHNMIKNEHRYLPSNPDYFRYVQREIRPHMRKIVADWMLEVNQELGCQPEVFCLAVSLMDRFLARCRIQKSQLQLLGAVCLFLSSKFKETTPISSENLVMYTDFSVSLEEIRDWELIVLHKLKWDLCSSTALDYLDHLLPKLIINANVDHSMLRRQTETIIALTSTHYMFSYVRPSVIASSAIAVALRCLVPAFSEEGARQFLAGLQNFSQADAADLEECSTAMIQTLPAYLVQSSASVNVCVNSTGSSPTPSDASSPPVTPPPPAADGQPNQIFSSPDINSTLSDSFRHSSVLVKSC